MNQENFKYQKGKKGRGLVFSRRFAYGVRALLSSPIFLSEKSSLLGFSQPTNDKPSRVMDDISNATNGYGLERLSKIIRFLVRKQTSDFDNNSGLLEQTAKISPQQRKEIVLELNKSGFVKIPQFISKKDAEALYESILNSPGIDRRKVEYTSQLSWLSDDDSPRIDANRKALETSTGRVDIDFASLKLIARDFLDCRPIQLGPNSWTTKAIPSISTEEIDENAMAFHSDSDYFGFVKAFLLLTKVDENSGPFTFVAESHLQDRQVQGRLRDEDLGYAPSELRYGTGEPGDLVLAVTTGWHKASIPKKGHRMMVQWLFTNTLFGSASQ